MPLSSEIGKSLAYLRRKYKISEKDLVSLAKKLSKGEESEESWEEITQNYLKQRKVRKLSSFGQRGKVKMPPLG
jgi:hypothetical protein